MDWRKPVPVGGSSDEVSNTWQEGLCGEWTVFHRCGCAELANRLKGRTGLMDDPRTDLETELRVSPKIVVAGLVFLGVVLVFTDSLWPDQSREFKALALALLLYTAAPTIWLLGSWKPWVGRWFTIIVLVALVGLTNAWLRVPGCLTLFVIPTALAVATMSPLSAFIVAVAQTLLLLLLPHLATRYPQLVQIVDDSVAWAVIGVTIVTIWVTLALMYAMSRSVHQVATWSQIHYQSARELLEEARNRKVELEQALDELAHANRQLELANERMSALRLIAEDAQKTKAAFVAKVSHEFRTPLNMIIGLIDLLVETPEVYGRELPPALFEDLDIVHRNCEHLSSMVNDVLALSQAEAGYLTLHREWVNLGDIIDEALTVVRPLLQQKGLRLRVDVPSSLPEVSCDRTRVRQVILNLLSNAARFTENGGVTIQVKEQSQRVVVSVADTGPGISSQEAKRIFEPFYQSSDRPWRNRSGSGLGLSISKQFIELHGGRIWVESEPGVGTTVYFNLPVTAPKAHIARPGRWIKEDWIWMERRAKVSLPSLPAGPRVVVCDSTGELVPAFTHIADKVEFVDTRDWAQAVDELQQCPAHAVVFNAASPDELWSLVERTRLSVPDIPVIGCHLPPRAARALEAGAAGYLVKPIKRAQLTEAVQRVGKPLRTILVVDDDRDVRRLLTRMLQDSDGGVKVVTASSGKQALDRLRGERPELVLLDIMMPDMDGWQVLELKREDEEIRDIPVILVSALDPTEQPMTSEALLATMGKGLSVSKLLSCSLGLSELLLQPDSGPGPVRG